MTSSNSELINPYPLFGMYDQWPNGLGPSDLTYPTVTTNYMEPADLTVCPTEVDQSKCERSTTPGVNGTNTCTTTSSPVKNHVLN
jgi:hypothetical protein